MPRPSPPIIRTAMSAIEVERARTRYTSTQEMSWMVLAARAVIEQSKTIALDVGGTVHNGSLNRMFRDGALEQDFRVTNKGDQPLRAVVAVSGSPLVAEPASSNGLTVERKYYTTAGEPVDIATVKQNTRLVAVLSVMKSERPVGERHLPAGRSPARRLRDREPDAGRLGRHGQHCLAHRHDLGQLHRVPR